MARETRKCVRWTAAAGAILALALGGCGQAANHTANAVNATGNAAALAARGTANAIRGVGNAATDAARLGPAGDRNAWTRNPFGTYATQSVEIDHAARTVNIRLANPAAPAAGAPAAGWTAPGTPAPAAGWTAPRTAPAGAPAPGWTVPGTRTAPAAVPGTVTPGRTAAAATAPTITVPTGWTVRVTAPATGTWNHGLAVVPYRDGTAPVGTAAARTPGTSRVLNFRANTAGLYAIVATTPGAADRVLDILNVSNGNRTPAVLTYHDGWR
ncbi:hypothetical protein [Alicyclobacillus sp.]|uniref:hypothetical protein n=1 Tax=Alicyclobacillus sp. TaxID=61169 RepID=UPI0025C3E066|nr:hypothetical protein [Alicyclobacillus sp.]MCL6517613.1 hypothetical protein [Alicyclobacillus sp.]